ncbi:SDR family oxidoreductase [Microlunatus sp. Gsoil 973]|uniref:SDR family oxidoreductase n=1 Tax=Microlunatus sp. Gsoil 973 TaxID=2672569 RepID=UPI0012B4CC51|nr:SDR family oxidoreductase [Microlunatus sp. Gsoil 973]QGN31989.1 SDR family oxidoreductase [Microlunatus sp. Gsoil 973]
MDLQLTDRVFIVTAASSGLGRACAAALVAEGAKVVLVARRSEMLAEVVTELGAESAVSLTADLADPQTAERAVRTALDGFGRLDGALISVGGPAAGPVVKLSDDQWRDAFESVFLSALRVVSSVIENSTAPDPAIAVVLSTSVKSPIGGLSASNGLRPGLAMLIKQLSDEHGPDGLRINGLLPGRIDTDRVKHLDSLSPDPAAARASGEQSIPLRRYGDPAEFGRVAAFLLSPAASYVTGSMIAVDGGALRTL